MNVFQGFLLLLLASLWGASFLFMRISVPALGPAVLILGRVLSAAIFLFIVAKLFKRAKPEFRYWKHFLTLGFLNSAFPFFMYAYAAQTLTASLLSILNATAPIWGRSLRLLSSKRS